MDIHTELLRLHLLLCRATADRISVDVGHAGQAEDGVRLLGPTAAVARHGAGDAGNKREARATPNWRGPRLGAIILQLAEKAATGSADSWRKCKQHAG